MLLQIKKSILYGYLSDYQKFCFNYFSDLTNDKLSNENLNQFTIHEQSNIFLLISKKFVKVEYDKNKIEFYQVLNNGQIFWIENDFFCEF
jgi:hypothetical protein